MSFIRAAQDIVRHMPDEVGLFSEIINHKKNPDYFVFIDLDYIMWVLLFLLASRIN